MIVEELVFPHEMTLDMLKQYELTHGILHSVDLSIVFRKLYRSARYWRVDPKKYRWLVEHLKEAA